MDVVSLKYVTPSVAAETILNFQGKKYTLEDYLMFRNIFDSPADDKLMMAGRQVSKTITLAADMVVKSSMIAYSSLLYANASGSQTNSFSTSKLDHFLLHSPVVYNSLMHSKYVINNVHNKRFANFSEIRLSYFSDTADRIRGNSGEELYLDEVQDMLYDAIIDAEQCLSAALHPKITYAGTSKTTDGTLNYLWENSTQKKWLIKCDSCSKYNIPSIENIKPEGLCCKNCGALLNTYAGIWHSFGSGKIDGYHIPQVIMPIHCCNKDKWDKLYSKFKSYPEYKFLNEVMGLPFGENETPITEEMLHKMCISNLPMQSKLTPIITARYIVAGIDWGGNGVHGTSRTVLSIFAVYPERPEYVKIYGKIYSAGEPSAHVEDIADKLNKFNVVTVYGDHGGGNFAMSQLSRYVPHIRITPVMYTDQKNAFTWSEQSKRFTVNRTIMIDAFFMDIKFNVIKAMRWEDFEPFARDILNEKITIIGDNKRMWTHHPAAPDDSLHSMVFGWFACRVLAGRLDFFGDTP